MSNLSYFQRLHKQQKERQRMSEPKKCGCGQMQGHVGWLLCVGKGIEHIPSIPISHRSEPNDTREEVELPTMASLSVEHKEFEASERTKGVAWKEIPNLTDWVLMRLFKAEAANRDLRFANVVNSDEWRQRVESLEAANREKDAEIERLKIELAKTGTGDFTGDFYLGRKTLSGYLRDAENDRDGWKRMYDANKEELASLRASGGEKWIEIKEGCEMPEDGVDILFNIPWCYGVEKGRSSEGKWISDRTSPYNDEVSFDADDATHWMPLPAPPTLTGEKE